MRRFYRLIRGLFFVGLTLFSTLLLLGHYDSTSQWLIRQAIQYAKHPILIGKITGNLWQQLELNDLQFQSNTASIRVQTLRLSWQASDLWSGNLHIRSLNIEGVDATITRRSHPQPTKTPVIPQRLSFPFNIQLDQLSLTDMVLHRTDEKPFLIDQIDSRLHSNQQQFTLEYVHIQSPQLTARLTGKSQLTMPYPLSFELDWQLKLPQKGELSGSAQIKGEVNQYDIQLASTHRSESHNASQWQFQLTGNRQQLQLTQGSGNLWGGNIQLTGKMSWEDSLSANLHIETQQLSPPLRGLSPSKSAPLTFMTDLELAHDTLTLHPMTVALNSNSQFSLQGQMTQFTTPQRQFNIHLNWLNLGWPIHATAPQWLSPKGDLSMTGTPQHYELTLKAQATGQKLPQSDWIITGTGKPKSLQLSDIQGQLLDGQVQAKAHLDWSASPTAEITLQATHLVPTSKLPQWDNQAPINLSLVARLKDNNLQLKPLLFSVPSHNILLQGEVSAMMQTDQKAPEFHAKLSWQNLQWPLTPSPPPLSLRQGKLQVDGTTQDYQLSLNTELAGIHIPEGNWTLNATGNPQSLQIQQLTGQLLAGSIKLQGKVAWKPTLQWQLSMDGSNLHPEKHWADFPGTLAVTATTQGEYSADHPLSSHLTLGSTGNLRGHPLSLDAKAQIQGKHYTLSDLSFLSGNNQITGSAQLKDDLVQAQWSVRLPNLAQLLPDTQGQLSGKGRITGSLNTPSIQTDLTGTNLRYKKFELNQLDLALSLDQANDDALSLQLTTENISHNDRLILRNLQLSSEGRLAHHTLKLKGQLDADQAFNLKATGDFDPKTTHWQGKLSQLNIQSTDFSHWQLVQPTQISGSLHHLSIANTCINTPQQASLCADFSWKNETGSRLHSRLANLPLQWFHPLIDGKVQGDLRGNLSASGRLEGTFNMDISSGHIQLPFDPNHAPYPHQGGSIHTTLSSKGLDSRIKLALLDNSHLTGTVSLPALHQLPINHPQPIKGQLRATLADLEILSAFMPNLANTQGKIEADIQLAGNLQQPQITGDVNTRNLSIELPDLGLHLDKVKFHANTHNQPPNQWQLDGSIHSGDGQLDLTGNINITNQRMNLKVTGENVTVIHTADLKANISPDLHIQISPHRILSTGKITIPSAAITPQIVLPSILSNTPFSTATNDITPNVILPSDDAIILDSTHKIPTKAIPTRAHRLPLALDSQINIQLGDDIWVETAGFRSRLQGQLTLRHHPDDNHILPTANGDIHIINGTFRSFGQHLDIDQGTLLFTDTLITQPTLDIIASRKIHDDPQVTQAGIHLTGTPQKVDLRFFSTPDLEQSTVLSYILTGSPPEDKSTALNLGTYILPDLYVGYGIDLIDNQGTFNIRYHIKQNFGIEADIGETNKVVTFSYVLEH